MWDTRELYAWKLITRDDNGLWRVIRMGVTEEDLQSYRKAFPTREYHLIPMDAAYADGPVKH